MRSIGRGSAPSGEPLDGREATGETNPARQGAVAYERDGGMTLTQTRALVRSEHRSAEALLRGVMLRDGTTSWDWVDEAFVDGIELEAAQLVAWDMVRSLMDRRAAILLFRRGRGAAWAVASEDAVPQRVAVTAYGAGEWRVRMANRMIGWLGSYLLERFGEDTPRALNLLNPASTLDEIADTLARLGELDRLSG